MQLLRLITYFDLCYILVVVQQLLDFILGQFESSSSSMGGTWWTIYSLLDVFYVIDLPASHAAVEFVNFFSDVLSSLLLIYVFLVLLNKF